MHGFQTYVIGFLVSTLLTSLAFGLVVFQMLAPQHLIYTIASLAMFQAAFQLRFFLHLGKEGKPYWETSIFFFMLFILLIIVLGSLWIMKDLNERMM